MPATRTAPSGTCRLTLTINGRDYTVRPLSIAAPEDFGVTRGWRLRRTDSGARSDVAGHADGSRSCTCPDHIFRRDGIDPAGCKHARALAALGLL